MGWHEHKEPQNQFMLSITKIFTIIFRMNKIKFLTSISF